MFDVTADIARAQALAEILCGAAQIDGELDPDEAVAVDAELKSLLKLDALPPDLQRHVRSFNRTRFDMVDTLMRLRLNDLTHKKALMRSVRTIIKADAIMRDVERDYFARLAQTLRVAPSDID